MEVGTFRGIKRASGCLSLPGFQYGRDDIGQRRGDQCKQLSRGPGGDTQIDPPAGSTEWGRGGVCGKDDQCEQLSCGPGGDTQIDPPGGSTECEWGGVCGGGSVISL